MVVKKGLVGGLLTLSQFLESISSAQDWDTIKSLCSDSWIVMKGYTHQFRVFQDVLQKRSSSANYDKKQAAQIRVDTIHLFHALYELCYALKTANTAQERKTYLHTASTRINDHLDLFTHDYHQVRRDNEIYASLEHVRVGVHTQATNIDNILGTIEKAGIITRKLRILLIEHAQDKYPTELRSFANDNYEELSTWAKHTRTAVKELEQKSKVKII